MSEAPKSRPPAGRRVRGIKRDIVSYSSPQGLRELVDTAAAADGCNRSAWIVLALEERLAREGWWVDAATGEHFREDAGTSGKMPEGAAPPPPGAVRVPPHEAPESEPAQFAEGGQAEDWLAQAAGIDWEEDE